MTNEKGFILWLLGPTSSGKTTIATHLTQTLKGRGFQVLHYDGDEVRDFFGDGFGFSGPNRLRVVMTLVHLANKGSDIGVNIFVSALTANNDARDYVLNNAKNLKIIYVKCGVDTCMKRDPKGLYKLAEKGEIDTLIGFNGEYNPPEQPDIIVDTGKYSLDECCIQIEEFLAKQGII